MNSKYTQAPFKKERGYNTTTVTMNKGNYHIDFNKI